MKEVSVKSPVSGQESIFVKDYDVKRIISEYKTLYGVEVESEMRGWDRVSLYQCPSTDYEFFHPPLVGSNGFYEKLQRFEWYYAPWKWEHESSRKHLKEDDNVLEVGCGAGYFLERVRSEVRCNVWGVEYNQKALDTCKEKHIPVGKFDEDFFEGKESFFDVVCSYQVLEHLPDVKEFFVKSKRALRESGKLMVSVPNNDSFIKFCDGGTLNFPPHHIGWWTENSLKRALNYFGFNVIEVLKEPLQEAHYDWYTDYLMTKFHAPKFVKKIVFKEKLRFFRHRVLSLFAKKIIGHSILVVAQKK